jgi:hypothetical protein
MATIDKSASSNVKIHPGRVRLPSVLAGVIHGGGASIARTSPTLRSKLAKRVRDLAHRRRTSERAVVDLALWLFFEKKHDLDVLILMEKAGIAPRRRRA